MQAENIGGSGSLLNENAVADLLGISTRTLQSWRVKGGGPAYTKLGRAVRYRRVDIDRWIDANVTSSTSEETARERIAD